MARLYLAEGEQEHHSGVTARREGGEVNDDPARWASAQDKPTEDEPPGPRGGAFRFCGSVDIPGVGADVREMQTPPPFPGRRQLVRAEWEPHTLTPPKSPTA